MNETLRSSLKSLENLYSIMAGISLSVGMYSLFEPNRPSNPIKWELLPYFLTFLVILIPFYHGALRHLDDAYNARNKPEHCSGAVHFIDFLMLLVEGCVLVAVAVLTCSPIFFAWAIVILLSLDIAWAVLTNSVGISGDKWTKPERKWAKINSSALLILILFLCFVSPRLSAITLGIGLLVLSFLRSVVDYWCCWEFYYPEDTP